MPVKLKLIPPAAQKPDFPIGSRWFKSLAGLLIPGFGWGYFTGMSLDAPAFWIIAVVLPFIVWLTAIWLRMMIYLPALIQANAWNKRREELLLSEVRRGRRALQILHSTFITAHSEPEQTNISSVGVLTQNKQILHMQPSWHGNNSYRLSRLPIQSGMTRDDLIQQIFNRLVAGIARHLKQLPENHPVALLFEVNTSLPAQRLHSLWRNAWENYDIRQCLEPVIGHGVSVVDNWLDDRIREETVLLIIALQVDPDKPEGTGEAAVALLLGNRLTQHILTPQAVLQRVEESFTETLAENIAQALDWVPAQPADSRVVSRSG